MTALRVLIIENEAIIALLFAEVLEEMGHVVCGTEATEAGAITAASISKPDLIITDVRLREGNGIAAMNAILHTGFVPHVYVSGDMIDQNLISPAAGLLQKPFYEQQLVKAIERALDPANIAVGEKHAADARVQLE